LPISGTDPFGANTAIFSLIHSVLIQPLIYPEPERLVDVWETVPNGGRNSVSGGAFKDWREHSSTFEQIALYKYVQLNLTGSGTPEHVAGMWVSTEYLQVLGVRPLLGRGFLPGEDALGGNNGVVVLAHPFWQRRYGGDPGIVGRSITLNQNLYTVIGVLPPGALLQDEAMFLVPFVIDANTDTIKWDRGYHCCGAIGRVNPGLTAAEAQAELRGMKQQFAAEYPPWKKDWSVDVIPLRQDLTGDIRPTLSILLGTVGLVLLVACANVSNLLLARGHTRSREMAIRVALGASSGRLIRQLLIESLLLAFTGCALGLVLAAFAIKQFPRMLAGLVPQMLHPSLDVNVTAFSILIAGGCGILFGLLPAIRASRPDVNHMLKETDRGSQSAARRRSQSALIVAEFAFTLVLLIGAGLFLRSFVRLLAVDPGFNPRQTLAFDLSLSKAKYPGAEDQQRFLNELTGRIASLPGVDFVGAATTLPLSNRGRGSSVRRADQPERQAFGVQDDFVSGDYFSALQIPLLRGRLIDEADNRPTAPPVMVIDARVARELYPDEDPIGKIVEYGPFSWEIVGVVASIRHSGLDQDARARVFGPRAHFSYPTAGMVVRSGLPPSVLVDTLRKTVLAVDPDQPIANVRTLEEAVQRSLARQRTTLVLLGLFALIAITLACIGIYGVISYSVGQRARELGIRAALGARRGDIIRLVLAGGAKLSFFGMGIGLMSSFLLSRLVEKLLFEVRANDPFVFLSSVGLLGLVAALSIYLPARRAARADPMLALRNEV
jgi:predicted permease